MMRFLCGAVVALVGVPAAAQARAPEARAGSADRCARLLPPATVARIAGTSSVRLVPFEPRIGAGGECNYAEGDSLVLMLDVEHHAWAAMRFHRLRDGALARAGQQAVAGLGDEAFTYGTFGQYLVVRRGDTVIRLTSWAGADPYAVRPTPPPLTRGQLIALARRVLATP